VAGAALVVSDTLVVGAANREGDHGCGGRERSCEDVDDGGGAVGPFGVDLLNQLIRDADWHDLGHLM